MYALIEIFYEQGGTPLLMTVFTHLKFLLMSQSLHKLLSIHGQMGRLVQKLEDQKLLLLLEFSGVELSIAILLKYCGLSSLQLTVYIQYKTTLS